MKLSGIICMPDLSEGIFKMVSQSVDTIQTSADGVLPHWNQSSDCRLNGQAGPHLKSTKVLVTGGGGYFGYNLGCALTKLGITVVLFDIQKPKWEVPNGAMYFQVCKITF